MEKHQSRCILKEEIEEVLLSIVVTSTCNSTKCFGAQSRIVGNVNGVVRLVAYPYYGLTLDTGTDEHPYVIPLTVVDPVRHFHQWSSILDRYVLIQRLFIACERFLDPVKENGVDEVSIFVKWEDITVLEDNMKSEKCFNIGKVPYEHAIKHPAATDLNANSLCHLVVHHVSTPFIIDKPKKVYCLVYISFTDSRRLESKLWLVLRGEQVTWRSFLFPNREYYIGFPPNIDKYFFQKSQMPLEKLFTKRSKELGVILHHKTFSTLNATIVPTKSKLYLKSNSEFSEFVYKFSKDPLSVWFSADEANRADVELVTFYGQVSDVLYSKDVDFVACYVCHNSKPMKPTLKEPHMAAVYPWMNPWRTQLSLGDGKDKLVEIPISENVSDSSIKIGVPGNMVQIVKLRDLVSGVTQDVYMKHSCTPHSQQACRLVPGIVVCISHLKRRYSKGRKYYFITTLLSCITVLSYPAGNSSSEDWGEYGLRSHALGFRNKMWGVLEAFNIFKVAISVKCSKCNTVVSRNTCSQNCDPQTFHINSSYAIGWLQIIHSNQGISMEKVLIKGDNVQKLLCMSEDIWQMFLKAAKEEELVCLNNNQSNEDLTAPLRLNEMFKIYCNLPKASGKFYISVRKLNSLSDADPLYYCIYLEPLSKDRLEVVARLARQVCV